MYESYIIDEKANESFSPFSPVLFDTSYEFLVVHNTSNIGKGAKPLHLHPGYEIYYNNSEESFFYFNNCKFLKLNKGDLMVVPPFKIHRSMDMLKCYDVYIINFTHKLLNNILSFPLIGDPPVKEPDFIDMTAIGNVYPYKVNIPPDKRDYVKAIFKNCIASEQSNKLLNVLIDFCKILNTVDTFFKNAEPEPYEEYIPTSWSGKTLKYIEEHIEENISVGEIAENLFVNRSYLCNAFKKETGLSISQYILMRRITESEKLMLENVPIKDILKITHFKTPSHFSSCFKKVMGFSPSHFSKHYVTEFREKSNSSTH